MLGGSDQIILIANNSFLDSIQKQHFDRQHLNLIIVFSGENALRSFPSHGFDLGPAIDFGIFLNSGRGPSHCVPDFLSAAMIFLGPSQDEPLMCLGAQLQPLFLEPIQPMMSRPEIYSWSPVIEIQVPSH